VVNRARTSIYFAQVQGVEALNSQRDEAVLQENWLNSIFENIEIKTLCPNLFATKTTVAPRLGTSSRWRRMPLPVRSRAALAL
jgi:hypothetical protein